MLTYQLAEKAVLEYFNSSKDCYAARFTDTHDINSQLRRFRTIGSPMVYAHRNPSDFIVVERGDIVLVYFSKQFFSHFHCLKGICFPFFNFAGIKTLASLVVQLLCLLCCLRIGGEA